MRRHTKGAATRRFESLQDRRRFLATMGLGGLFYTVRGAFAQQLTTTPEQTLGPYYPDRMPLDQDNDLLIINDAVTPAIGEISWISGRILSNTGSPVRGALVEIWQADNNGAYIHSASPIRNRDANFQGYGKFLTGSSGEYLFRTVKPGLYPGRTRHIHFAVTPPGQQRFVTQLYVQGEALNNNDGVLSGIRDATQRASVIVPWSALPNSRIGELSARFDVVLGYTPSETTTTARPRIFATRGVVNSGSLIDGVANGAWISVFGQNLAPAARTWTTADISEGKLPRTLDGVQVSIGGKPAAVSYISPTQLNVQAPDLDAPGNVEVVVTTASGASDPVRVEAQALLPAFFLMTGDNVAAVRADGVYLGPESLIEGVRTLPAQAGDVITLFGTGFGPTTPAIAAGELVQAPAPLANAVQIYIDTIPANVSFAGLSSAGLYQFNLSVPDLPDGDHTVRAQIGGVWTKKLGRLRVQRAATSAVTHPAMPTQLAKARFDQLRAKTA